jgi:hypothetical protein
MSALHARATLALGGLLSALLAAACDPGQDPAVWLDGPPFLIVAPAADQSAPQGVTMYAQARGGNYLGVVTRGATFSYGSQTGLTRSCIELPGYKPLYFVLEPSAAAALVDARLYAMCAAIPADDMRDRLDICESEGTINASVEVPVVFSPDQRNLLGNAPDGAASAREAGQ